MTALSEGSGTDAAFPRIRHWLISATLLLAVTLVVPVLAGLI